MRGLTLGAEKDWFPDSADWFGWDTFKVTIIIFHDFIKNKNFEMIIFDWFFSIHFKSWQEKTYKNVQKSTLFSDFTEWGSRSQLRFLVDFVRFVKRELYVGI